MKRAAVFLMAILVGAGAIGLACSKREETAKETAREPAKEYMAMGEFVSPEDTLPHVRYFEGGLVSLNDRCAVRKVKLNPKMPPVYVNGQPVGFC